MSLLKQVWHTIEKYSWVLWGVVVSLLFLVLKKALRDSEKEKVENHLKKTSDKVDRAGDKLKIEKLKKKQKSKAQKRKLDEIKAEEDKSKRRRQLQTFLEDNL
jgi:biopolymer transport protein ExbB/TolQ